ncbi:MAG: M20/M25/M40 family metallo-hydrolase [Chloroflexota bacterium]
MLPLNLPFPRLSWPLRRWLLPVVMIVCLLLSCAGFSSVSPPTLQVQPPTATYVAAAPITPTPSLPAGAAVLNDTVDPTINDLLDLVQSDRLMVAVGALADMHSRHVLSKPTSNIGGISGARDWLIAQFNAIRTANPQQPITVWTQGFQYTWNGFNISTQNVVSIFQGTDIGTGVIVIGAHYDSITTDYTNGQTYAPGANDNGSGVAAMLEVARILAGQPHRTTLIFVAFAAEETGRQGSIAFVKSYLQAQTPPVDVRAMINLDIIGSEMGPNGVVDQHTLRLFSAEPNDSPSRQEARQIALIIKTYLDDVDPVLQSAEERTGRWGDQQSFRAAGYPAIRMIQGLEDLSRQHTPRDTIDNVQPGYLMRITRALLVCLAILADGPTPPTNIALRVPINSPQTQTLVWTPSVDATEYLVVLRQTSSLYFDQSFTIKATASPELTWSGFDRFATVAIAAVNKAGRMGPLTPELSIASLLRR